jgi:hypothetical protein
MPPGIASLYDTIAEEVIPCMICQLHPEQQLDEPETPPASSFDLSGVATLRRGAAKDRKGSRAGDAVSRDVSASESHRGTIESSAVGLDGSETLGCSDVKSGEYPWLHKFLCRLREDGEKAASVGLALVKEEEQRLEQSALTILPMKKRTSKQNPKTKLRETSAAGKTQGRAEFALPFDEKEKESLKV